VGGTGSSSGAVPWVTGRGGRGVRCGRCRAPAASGKFATSLPICCRCYSSRWAATSLRRAPPGAASGRGRAGGGPRRLLGAASTRLGSQADRVAAAGRAAQLLEALGVAPVVPDGDDAGPAGVLPARRAAPRCLPRLDGSISDAGMPAGGDKRVASPRPVMSIERLRPAVIPCAWPVPWPRRALFLRYLEHQAAQD
jgi:hypothetical protein